MARFWAPSGDGRRWMFSVVFRRRCALELPLPAAERGLVARIRWSTGVVTRSRCVPGGDAATEPGMLVLAAGGQMACGCA